MARIAGGVSAKAEVALQIYDEARTVAEIVEHGRSLGPAINSANVRRILREMQVWEIAYHDESWPRRWRLTARGRKQFREWERYGC